MGPLADTSDKAHSEHRKTDLGPFKQKIDLTGRHIVGTWNLEPQTDTLTEETKILGEIVRGN